ncbi:MAG: VTT domain-containing protein [Chloroflexi bacterium]|nr:VTT domain-containing protein [Chloroflexota bacterium]MCL5274865.1 VTT domain-containing protein [Chloroflexota bacterium]
MVDLIEKTLTALSQGPFPFLAYAAVWFIIFAESGLFFGFFLPGDSLLVTCGALAALPTSPFHIAILLPLLAFAAVLGDNVGYWFGKKTGPRIFSRPESRFFKPKYLKQAHAFYEKHGGKTIIIARFMPFVRTFAPIVAGAVDMEYKRFFAFNLIGGVFWTVSITLVGYLFGNIPFVKNNLEVALVVVILLSLAPIAIHQIIERRNAKNEILAAREEVIEVSEM